MILCPYLVNISNYTIYGSVMQYMLTFPIEYYIDVVVLMINIAYKFTSHSVFCNVCAYLMLCNVQCRLHTIQCIVSTYITYYILYIVQCTMYIAHCTLYILYIIYIAFTV